MDGRERKAMRPGLTVDIVLKQDQRTGRLKRGVVQVVLTNFYTIPFCRCCGKTGMYQEGLCCTCQYYWEETRLRRKRMHAYSFISLLISW